MFMKHEKNYYQILGISPKATSMEIRRVYRQLAILNHPDRNPSSQATLRMQEINEAYSVLGEKHKRIKYDSERGNFHTRAQTTSAPQRTATNLQQVFAEDVIRRIGFLPLVIAIAVLVISTSILYTNWLPPWWSMFSHWWFWIRVFWDEQKPTFFAFFTVLLSLASIGSLSFRMLSKFREIEAQCPKCGKDWAAENLNKKLSGVPLYKTNYRCKYCFYEWQFIKTKK
jgi:hypothetical protein